MELALYHPEYGYYSDPKRRVIGRKGDFFTSVSVGETFGFLLAERIGQEWDKWGGDEPVVIVEQGAHDGQLARDIVAALRAAGKSCDYRIVEPRVTIREWLQGRPREEDFPEIRVVASFADAKAPAGLFLCNELLDAFPFRRMVFEGGKWKEQRVSRIGNELGFALGDLDSSPERYAVELGSDFPDGYETEVCPAIDAWMKEAASLFECGKWWVIDYGYESPEYFSPSRNTGTFRCYRNHQASENPFEAPGEIDITAHVNFSHLREAAELAGLTSGALTDQHHFLIESARDWLLSIEGAAPSPELAKRLRQFQTLTHPGMMGQQFKVAEFGRGL